MLLKRIMAQICLPYLWIFFHFEIFNGDIYHRSCSIFSASCPPCPPWPPWPPCPPWPPWPPWPPCPSCSPCSIFSAWTHLGPPCWSLLSQCWVLPATWDEHEEIFWKFSKPFRVVDFQNWFVTLSECLLQRKIWWLCKICES